MSPFRKKRVAHRIAKWARNRLFQLITSADGERIVTLIGPGGAGKSAVADRVLEMLLNQEMPRMLADPGYLPILRVHAVTGLDGNYSWKDGFARLLEAGMEPLISQKTAFPKLQLDGAEIITTRGLIRDEFRRAFESMVRNRRIRYLFIDEGSAIVDEAVSRHPLRQFNILKSLAVGLKLVVVLIGGYDLAGIGGANGQLIRREFEVHMRRYMPSDDIEFAKATAVVGDELQTDIAEWSDAVDALTEAAPKQIRIERGVLDDKRMLLMRSIGCIGNYRDWLDRTCVDALVSHDGLITESGMLANALPNKKLLKLTIEAELGEKQLADIDEIEIARKYGLESLNTPAEQTARRGVGRRVGVRGPSRDQVGNRSN